MTLFTIEHLTRKDTPTPEVKSPGFGQRNSFLSVTSMFRSARPQTVPWVIGDTDSEGRSMPTSSDSDHSPTTSPTDKPSSTGPPARMPSPKEAVKTEDASPGEGGRQKPPHSYIALIAMAILDSSPRMLLLCDIYEYIMEHYPYFRNNERSWRNSIRHNLSLNECFIKAGRSDDGRGHFWAIHPANADDFSRGDFRRRRARRRVKADFDVFAYPGYQFYPTAMPTPYGYVPMTYTPMSSVFPSGITPYIPPRFPPYPSAVPTGYIQATATGAVPSVSSPSLTSISVPTVCTSACTSSTSRQSPVACTSPSCSPPMSQHSPLYAPPLIGRSSTMVTPHTQSSWTSYTRGFHPYM